MKRPREGGEEESVREFRVCARVRAHWSGGVLDSDLSAAKTIRKLSTATTIPQFTINVNVQLLGKKMKFI